MGCEAISVEFRLVNSCVLEVVVAMVVVTAFVTFDVQALVAKADLVILEIEISQIEIEEMFLLQHSEYIHGQGPVSIAMEHRTQSAVA